MDTGRRTRPTVKLGNLPPTPTLRLGKSGILSRIRGAARESEISGNPDGARELRIFAREMEEKN